MIFSSSSKIGFDIMLARDEKSMSHYSTSGATEYGVFSKAVEVKTQNTTELWNLPPFPGDSEKEDVNTEEGKEKPKKKNRGPRKVHLVMISHGLHSNTGADMIYLKESIDKVAEEARKSRKAKRKGETVSHQPDRDEPDQDQESEDDDEEQVITRGFFGNVCRTERGIKYLGKRLAKYVFQLAWPDEPFPRSLRTNSTSSISSMKQPSESDPHKKPKSRDYKVTSISFLGHSLGGLVQTYAIAYIHAHIPEFFQEVVPVNFIALATPFLGLSNENPIYVKFALDFGLVGRTGQDLGLKWKTTNVATSAFSALSSTPAHTSATGESSDNVIAGAKPLLKILPTGPAKQVLKMFRNRTLYANVVNDGIVPLRTSCMLFLDWKGLGRVEKARRQHAGPVGQVSGLVGWGWGQLTAGNSGQSTPRKSWSISGTSNSESNAAGLLTSDGNVAHAPQKSEETPGKIGETGTDESAEKSKSVPASPGPLSSFLTLFKPYTGRTKQKTVKIYERSQTMDSVEASNSVVPPSPHDVHKPSPLSANLSQSSAPTSPKILSQRPTTAEADEDFPELDPTNSALGQATAATESSDADEYEKLIAPPRTTLLEAAGDVLNPPLPPLQFLINPDSRERTIYHDRVYHPNDIPPVVPRSPTAHLRRSNSSSGGSIPVPPSPSKSHLKPEEKIARAYHDEVSWRKVLVRLEPDAHNNIIVRREFSNAYGWPVVKHLVDTHFADTFAANTRDDEEQGQERAFTIDKALPNQSTTEVAEAQPKTQAAASDTPKLFTPSQSNNDDDDEHGKQDSKMRPKRLSISTPANDRKMNHTPGYSSEIRKALSAIERPGSPFLSEDPGIWSDGAFATDEEEDEDDEEKEEKKRLDRMNSFLERGKQPVHEPKREVIEVRGRGKSARTGNESGAGSGLAAKTFDSGKVEDKGS